MTRRYALRDDQWERVENLLPGREDRHSHGFERCRTDLRPETHELFTCAVSGHFRSEAVPEEVKLRVRIRVS